MSELKTNLRDTFIGKIWKFLWVLHEEEGPQVQRHTNTCQWFLLILLRMCSNICKQLSAFYLKRQIALYSPHMWSVKMMMRILTTTITFCIDSIAPSLFVLNWLSWQIVSIRWQDPNNNTDTETRCLVYCILSNIRKVICKIKNE